MFPFVFCCSLLSAEMASLALLYLPHSCLCVEMYMSACPCRHDCSGIICLPFCLCLNAHQLLLSMLDMNVIPTNKAKFCVRIAVCTCPRSCSYNNNTARSRRPTACSRETALSSLVPYWFSANLFSSLVLRGETPPGRTVCITFPKQHGPKCLGNLTAGSLGESIYLSVSIYLSIHPSRLRACLWR